MKKIKHLSIYVSLSILAITAIMLSCQKHHVFTEEPFNIVNSTYVKNGKIPLNIALDNLQNFLSKVDGATRSQARTIKSIKTLNFEDISSNTRSESNHSGELFYIVNFENNQGYAILGADEIVEPVVAVTNSGEIGPLDKIFNPPTPIDGPTIDGPINPEDEDIDYTTLPQYCAQDNDFYLGSDSTIIAELIRKYVEYIRIAEPPQKVEGGGGNESSHIHYDTVEIVIPAMLTTRWNQREPFNNNIHKVGNKSRPVGCTTTASVQLIAQQKITNIGIFNLQNTTTTWDLLETFTYGEDFGRDTIAKADIAIICESIANDGIEVRYNFCGSEGTYGKMANVCRYLKNTAGFGDADLKRSYSTDNIINMLENHKPIIIGAFDIIARSGHAWVIDGMIAQFIYETVGTISKRQNLTRAPLFHCNWGWGGNHDGYYTSEIFDTKIHDKETNTNKNGAIITEPGDSTYSHTTDMVDVYYGEAAKTRFHYRYITY